MFTVTTNSVKLELILKLKLILKIKLTYQFIAFSEYLNNNLIIVPLKVDYIIDQFEDLIKDLNLWMKWIENILPIFNEFEYHQNGRLIMSWKWQMMPLKYM